MFWLYICCALVISVTAENQFAKKLDVQQLTIKVDSLTKDVAQLVLFMNTAIKEQNEINSQTKTEEGQAVKKAMNDSNIEGRVAALEEQMTVVNAEIAELDDQIENAEAQIVLIKSDQVLQDQRLLELEDDTEVLESSVQAVEGEITNLEAHDSLLNASINHLDSQTANLQETVTSLEETVTSLEETVTSLEETDADHTACIESLASNIGDLTGSVNDLDSRLEQLEYSGAIGFHAYLEEYDSLPVGTVVFDNIGFSVGGGFSTTTGQFTTPSDGAGMYYVYSHFQLDDGQYALFHIRKNGATVCGMYGDESQGGDQPATSCGAVVHLSAGDVVDVYYEDGSGSTPAWPGLYNSFNAFRIAPQ